MSGMLTCKTNFDCISVIIVPEFFLKPILQFTLPHDWGNVNYAC